MYPCSAAGHVRIFVWNGSTSAWVQRGSDIDGEAAGDQVNAVALSSDGNTVAIGAAENDGNGDWAGHVRVYTWKNGTSAWVQRGSDLDAEAQKDHFGWAVALSSDGNTVAVGARRNDGNGTDAGHVRVYTYSSGSTPTCATGTVTWDGGGADNRWSTAENWSTNLVPCTGAKVVFDATNKNCTLDVDVDVLEIDIQGSGNGCSSSCKYQGNLRIPTGVTVKVGTWKQSVRSTTVAAGAGGKKVEIGTLTLTEGAVFDANNIAGMKIDNLDQGTSAAVNSSSFNAASLSTIELGNWTLGQNAYFRGPDDGTVSFSGNVTIAGNAQSPELYNCSLVFNGSAGNQDLDIQRADAFSNTGGGGTFSPKIIIIRKTSGNVRMLSSFDINKTLWMHTGNLVAVGGTVKLGMKDGAVLQDRGNSYFEGTVQLKYANTSLSGSQMILPIGASGKKRPITISNLGLVNNWVIQFISGNTNNNGTAPLLAVNGVTTDGFYRITPGTNSGAKTFFRFVTDGQGSWADADLYVAKWNSGTSSWEAASNRGVTLSGLSKFTTSFNYTPGTDYDLALGVYDGVSSPIEMVYGENVSGNELHLMQASSSQVQTAGNRAGITFVAFPSPVTETLNLELNGAAQGIITLSDLSGKVIGTYPATTRSIDMRNIANGMYFVTFSDGVNRIAQRVIRN